MHEYDIMRVLKYRIEQLAKMPHPANHDIHDDYWGKLAFKGHANPQDMTIGEAFELGVFIERMWSDAIEAGDDETALRHVLAYRRRLNGKFGK